MITVCWVVGCGLVGIVWLYVVARVITRAVLRTIEERRRSKDGKA